MKVPLAMRLVFLGVLAWRLIIVNKKSKALDPKPYFDFNALTSGFTEKPVFFENEIETIKKFFRTISKSKTEESKQYYAVYLAQKLIKVYSKGGIFRFLWHNNTLALAFYQSLVFLQMHQESENMLKILFYISPENTKKLFEESSSKIKSEAFMPDPEASMEVFENFDKLFSIDKYCGAVIQSFSNENTINDDFI